MAAEPFIDSPLSLATGAVLVAVAVLWLRRYFRTRRQHGIVRQIFGLTLRVVFLLLAVIILADGTNRVGLNLCFEISEGREWCNHPQAEAPSEAGDSATED
ncbi:MAG: hypothetical protein OES78_13080 [Chromatiales bacterium]|nr:hypothetical protein [Chromatiales bacterium]